MAVFWVQQYFSLPVIYEDIGMGDEIQNRRAPSVLVDAETSRRGTSSTKSVPAALPQAAQQPAMEFETFPQQQFGHGAYQGTSAFNMGNMSNVLPDYQARNFAQQQYQIAFPSSGAPNPALLYQLQQGAQFAGQTPANYNMNFTQQYSLPYPQSQQQRAQHSNFPQFQPNLHGGPQAFASQMYYQQQPMLQNLPALLPSQNQNFFQPSTSHYGATYGTRTVGGYPTPQMGIESTMSMGPVLPYPQFPNRSLSRHTSDSSLRASIPRGPPRKPKQSGHALWVGNLPPGTNVIDLKDHFSREATADIESVFLISKSNCAFVNYKTEETCTAAMARFHDSRFQGVRLVCRLRRGSTPTVATPSSGPSTASQPITSADPEHESIESATEPGYQEENLAAALEDPAEKVKEKFFIVKSLTIEDLELSARNGIWATQAHNEAALNKAYQTAENVYLIFSANKSGEYFGYARMSSAIDEEAAAAIDFPFRPEVAEPAPADLPVTIPTPATSTAPKGHIIDDSARGTIFWEADVDPETDEQRTEDPGNISGEGEDSGGVSPASPQLFGKPFRITWVSTERLPFYRTRGLRNPWNANREVKIARDGTELEPTVGRRLISMFHRPQMPSTSPVVSRMQPSMVPNAVYLQQQPSFSRQY